MHICSIDILDINRSNQYQYHNFFCDELYLECQDYKKKMILKNV